jgi:GH25 family lysozyme M1 (1,4-beta-N-acetylmuramidase)
MRTAKSLRLAGALAVAAGLAVLGLTAAPAVAVTGRTATASLGHAAGGSRSNVGATHSPQLLRQLAGGAGSASQVSSRLATPSASTGALSGALQGVDVASFQHPNGAAISWADVAAAGIQFAAVKATEGAYYPNPYALADLANAQASGLSTVAYAFASPNGNGASNSPVAQADYFLNFLGAAGRTVPLMLDIEYDPYVSTDKTNECYGLSPSAMVSWISAFSAELRSKTGRLPLIYTPPSWWSTCTGGSTAFGQTPAWVPAWGNVASPALPAGWASWSFWQYSSTGTVSGITTTGSTDLDQLNPAVLPLLDPGNQLYTSGSAARWQLQRADPVTGQVPSYSAAGLPPGVSVSSGGRVAGWPGKPGTYQVSMRATASGGGSGSVSFAWTVRPAPDAGPTGRVRLDLGGKCLNDAGNHAANLTPVTISTCSLSAAQHWTVVQDDTLRIHGKCLDIYHGGLASGTPVDIYTCNGGRGQQWRVGTGTELVNPASGKCLVDPAGSVTNGTRLRIGSCTGRPSVKWTLPAGPVVSQIPDQCLDDSGNSTVNGNPVDLRSCNGTTAQAWQPRPDNTVRLHGKCLDVYHAGRVSGTPVDLYSCNGAGAQQWRVAVDGAGTRLVNPASGLCLGDPADATANGTRLKMITCKAGDPGMNWRVR